MVRMTVDIHLRYLYSCHQVRSQNAQTIGNNSIEGRAGHATVVVDQSDTFLCTHVFVCDNASVTAGRGLPPFSLQFGSISGNIVSLPEGCTSPPQCFSLIPPSLLVLVSSLTVFGCGPVYVAYTLLLTLSDLVLR